MVDMYPVPPPYTFALTFIPIFERYSKHNRLFNYLHKKAKQIKPMNDAHCRGSGHGCTSVYNQLYNSLDLVYLLNYTALVLSMSYILYQSSYETQITLSVGLSVGFYVAVLMTTVLYHFIDYDNS